MDMLSVTRIGLTCSDRLQADLLVLVTQQKAKKQPSRIISRVLTPALKVWLRSQVDQITNLQLDIGGSDRQFLSGSLPQVSLTAESAVYQGIHLSQIKVVAHQINVNLKQVLRGKPLQLLQPIPINIDACLPTRHLHQSLSTPLAKPAVMELLQTLLRPQLTAQVLDLEETQLQADQLLLKVCVASDMLPQATLLMRTRIALREPCELLLHDLDWQFVAPDAAPPQPLEDFCINLGSDVNLHSLSVNAVAIACHGQVQVQP